MWFRNSGGLIGSTPVPEPDETPQTQYQMPESAAMFTAEHEDTQHSIQQPSSGKGHGDLEDETTNKPDLPVTHDHPMDFRNDMMYNLTEENVASLFFDPSLNNPDPSLDFEWLFDNVSQEFNPNDLPMIVSPESSISATNISPPAFPMHTPHISYPHPDQMSNAPWVTVQARLLDVLNNLPPDVLMSPFFYPPNLAHFYNLYFENYHPHFPILHKPTLDPLNASPLLITAIVTLGSTLSSDVAHFETAVKIHDSLRYIIFNVSLWCCITIVLSANRFKSGDFEPPASLWCVQTLLLIQAHEKMFSTRKHHQLAHIFHGAIITVRCRFHVLLQFRC